MSIVLCVRRLVRAHCANYNHSRIHEKKDFRQRNFHITIFHLSVYQIDDEDNKKLLMRWMRDSS